MSVREQLEAVLRGWDVLEASRGVRGVIDYNCIPQVQDAVAVEHRLDVARALASCKAEADQYGQHELASYADAHLAYVRCLLGERPSLSEYVQRTQGCPASGWPEDYVLAVRDRAIKAIAGVGIAWGNDTEKQLEKQEGAIASEDVPECLRAVSAELEPVVRAATNATASCELSIEHVDEDAYWSCWLDGSGSHLRLRLNRRRAVFTTVQLRRFALHEVLAHGLQSVSWSSRASTADDASWLRLLAVHALVMVGQEGLAQALPLLLALDDAPLAARIRLDHYTQLVCAEMHLAINAGHSAVECAEHAQSRVPFWDGAKIADLLADRGCDQLLRSYLWSYPAGIDWFIQLADSGDDDAIARVLHAIYRHPATPRTLAELWPEGPPIGGPGATVRLRKSGFI